MTRPVHFKRYTAVLARAWTGVPIETVRCNKSPRGRAACSKLEANLTADWVLPSVTQQRPHDGCLLQYAVLSVRSDFPSVCEEK